MTENLRGQVLDANCPSRAILRRVTGRWGLLVMLALRGGRQRFGGIRSQIGGISEKMLAETLRHLEGDGLLIRHDYGEVPPRVDYRLTPLGAELADRLLALASFVEDHFAEMRAPPPAPVPAAPPAIGLAPQAR